MDGVFAAIGDRSCRRRGSADLGIRDLRHQKQGRRVPGANPRTGEAISISASTSATFKAGKTLKDVVNADPGS